MHLWFILNIVSVALQKIAGPKLTNPAENTLQAYAAVRKISNFLSEIPSCPLKGQPRARSVQNKPAKQNVESTAKQKV